MKKNLKLAISLASFLAVHASFALKTIDAQTPTCPGRDPIDSTFRVFTGPELLDNSSWTTEDQILTFLKQPKINSWLRGPNNDGNIADVDGATIPFPRLILNAADNPYSGDTPPVSKKPINPQLLVALVQSENGMLRREDRPDDDKLAHIVNCPVTPTTIAQQIQCAARTIRKWFDQLAACQPITPQTTWHLNKTQPTRDGVNVRPKNAASGAHFAYTDEAGWLWGGNRKDVGGSADFCRTWNSGRYTELGVFANPPTTPTLRPTNPTLTCSDPQQGQGSIDQRNVTLSVSGGTPLYTWRVTTTRLPTGAPYITGCGANMEDAELKPPTSNNVAGVAYTSIYNAAEPGPCLSGGTIRYEFGCQDQQMTCTDQFTAPACPGVNICNTFIPCGDLPYAGCANCKINPPSPSGGKIVDCRNLNPEMIKQGCLPCLPEMQGATVTVRDAAGVEVSRPVTVR